MILEYELANFKAFAESQIIPIKPITLIFGPNSSGKSSILQSLLLLKQTIEEQENFENALFSRGKIIDLGYYKDFVHRHDIDRSFSFKITIPKPDSVIQSDIEAELTDAIGSEIYNSILSAIKENTIGVRISFSFNNQSSIIFVSRVELFLGNNAEPLITYEGDAGNLQFSKANKMQKFWSELGVLDLVEVFKAMNHEERMKFLKEIQETWGKQEEEDKSKIQSAENIWLFKNDSIQLNKFLPNRLNRMNFKEILWGAFGREKTHEIMNPALLLLTISDYLDFMLKYLLIYIGPLRSYPERIYINKEFSPENVGMSGDMFQEILFKKPEMLKRVNEQLNHFNIPYSIKVSPYFKENSDKSNIFSLELIDNSSGVCANIRDVGFGISQVLPIIVQSTASIFKTLLIEQPELHLHPALQAELGDLFIKCSLNSSGGAKNIFIIETHSEHLILRILRRIRETSEGTLPKDIPKIKPEDISVLYVQPGPDGSTIKELRVNGNGDFDDQWPNGFFAERAKELF